MSDERPVPPGSENPTPPVDQASAAGSPPGDDQDLNVGKRKIGLAAIAIMGIHFLAKIGGYIQKRVLAHFFGASHEADACTGMEKIFQLIYYIPEELLTHSLLPVFTRIREEHGEDAAWRMASLTGTIHAGVLVLLTLFGIFGAPILVSAILPGFAAEPEKYDLTVHLVQVAMLGLFCTSIGSLTYVLLNAYKRFVTPALGDVAQKFGIVVGTAVTVVGFGEAVGPYGYAIGFIIGGVFKLLTHLVALRGQLSKLRPGVDFRNEGLGELGRLMVPLVGGTLISKLRDGWEQNIASRVPVAGTVASLDYAKKIVLMPVTVLPYALGIALFPFLADWAQKGDRKRVTEAFLGASRMMIFVFLPLLVMFLLFRQEIITVLYRSGRFRDVATDLTVAAFVVYSWGLISYALEIIANQVFYAHRDTRTPFLLGLVGSSLQILIAWLVGLQLGWGNAGIALGYALSKTIKLVLMWWQLRHRLIGYQWPSLVSMVGKCIVAAGLMGVFIIGAQRGAAGVLNTDSVMQTLLFLVVAGTLAGGIFLAAALVLKLDELELLLQQVRRKLKRGKA